MHGQKPELRTVPAIHPTIVKECAYCGVMIKGYAKVYVLRTPGSTVEMQERDLQIHPDCLLPFAHWMSEIAARAF
jgi:hypothetical protein